MRSISSRPIGAALALLLAASSAAPAADWRQFDEGRRLAKEARPADALRTWKELFAKRNELAPDQQVKLAVVMAATYLKLGQLEPARKLTAFAERLAPDDKLVKTLRAKVDKSAPGAGPTASGPAASPAAPVAASPKATPPGETWINKSGIKFSWIPAGTFEMGSPASEERRSDDEGPQHKVTISKGFWLGKTEVTNSQWSAVMADGKPKAGEEQRPKGDVSWDNCQEFCKKLSVAEARVFRLPTEAEWEYACRAGSTGTAYGTPGEIAWTHENSGDAPHDVGGKAPNEWGLQDMLGNVSEWCSDPYKGDYYQESPATDPTGPASGDNRIHRGGTYSLMALVCRAADRTYDAANRRMSRTGFRIVCEAKSGTP